MLKKRLMTSIVGGGLFFGFAFFLPSFFILLLVVLFCLMLFSEWPSLAVAAPRGALLSILCSMGIVMAHMLYWHQSFWLYSLYPFYAAWVVDSAAYMGGTFWGRHYCWPTISPKKTWEGVGAGIASLFILHGILQQVLPSFAALFSFSRAFFYAAGAMGGDMFFSWLKRRSKMKDTGELLPGHGGLFDRFDSVFGLAFVEGVGAVLRHWVSVVFPFF